MPNEIGHYIKEWRLYKELTQAELAQKTGISPASLSALETGVSNYTQKNLIPIAEALEVRPAQLIDEHPEQALEAEEYKEFKERMREAIRRIEPDDRDLALEVVEAIARRRPIKPRPSRQKKAGMDLESLRQHPNDI